MAFLFLYMTLAIDKLNGRGLSNNAHREHLPKNDTVLATELPGSSNKLECFSCRAERAFVATLLKEG